MSTLQRKGRGSTVDGDTVIFDSDVVAGSTLCFGSFHNGTTMNLSHNRGGAFTRIDPFVSLSGGLAIQIFWAPVNTSGPCTVSVANTGGAITAVQGYEVSNRAASPYFALESQACGASVTQETGAFTPPSDDCFLLYALRTDSAPSLTGPTGFTQAAAPNNGIYCFADYTQPIAASINPTVINGGSPSVGDVYCALFTAAGGGGSSAIAAIVNQLHRLMRGR